MNFPGFFLVRPVHKIVPAMLLASLLLPACSGLKITQHYDEEADFSSYRTFFMLPTDPAVDIKVNRYDKELLLRSIAGEMKSRGYTQNEAGGDLSVNMFVILDDKTGITNYTSFYTMGGWDYHYPFGYGYGGGNYQYTITKGTPGHEKQQLDHEDLQPVRKNVMEIINNVSTILDKTCSIKYLYQNCQP